MSHLFEARLVNDTFGDPGIYLDFRDCRRALLFDIGDVTALPPRKLMRVSHVFVRAQVLVCETAPGMLATQ